MSTLVAPYGVDELKPRLLAGNALAAERERAQSLPQVQLSSREVGDLIMIGIGGFTPLEGFMTRAAWEGVCDGMRTASGLFWPIPVTLSTDQATADGIKEGANVALVDGENQEIMATMQVTEKYTIDKAHECIMVFKTTDHEHPGVQMVMAQGEVNLAVRSRCCHKASSQKSTPIFFSRRHRPVSCSARRAGAPWRRSRRATRCTARTST